jgi:putative amino acid transporter
MIPVGGMIVGLLIAVFFSYRKPRTYKQKDIAGQETAAYTKKSITFALLAVILSLAAQVYLTEVVGVQGMIYGSLAGIIILYSGGAMKFNETDLILTSGMRMMAFIGFVMIAASGFASVLRETGHIETLVASSAEWIGSNQLLAAISLLIVTIWLKRKGRSIIYTLVPMIFVLFMTLWAMTEQVFFDWSGWGDTDGNLLLFVFGSIILGFALWIILEAIHLMRRFDKDRHF